MSTPSSLQSEKRWIVWKLNGDKKLPVDPITKKNIDCTKPENWMTHAEAIAVSDVTGVGFVVGDGWCYVDLDDSITDGQLSPLAQTLVKELDSYTEVSPSGTGLKIIIRATPSRNHAHKGLEIKGSGGYTTVTGRQWPGTPDEVQERGDVLGFIIAREFGEVEPPTPDDDRDDETGEIEADLTGLSHLIDDQRNVTLASIAGFLRDKGFEEAELLAALKAVNRRRCQPPLTDGEVEGIMRSYLGYRVPALVAALERMNATHMVVSEAGKTTVLIEDQKDGRTVYDRATFEDVRNFNRNKKYRRTARSSQKVDLGSAWLDWPGRREYPKVVFDPAAPPDPLVLNLWKGLAVKPAKGDWSLFQAHLLENVCHRNQVWHDYLLRWLARLFQCPGRLAEVAVAVKGIPGCGKSIIGRIIAQAFGQHALQITQPYHLTGHFNSHLQDCVFLFADEAVAPEDRAEVNILKGLITEPRLTIEGKNRNIVTAKSALHILIASNEERFVPVDAHDRRFFVLEVDPRHASDHAYFAAMLQQMDQGGLAAMVADLLALDISKWNHRAIPSTPWRDEQKDLGADHVTTWWKHLLENAKHAAWQGQRQHLNHTVHGWFTNELDRLKVNQHPDRVEAAFWKKVRKLCPGLTDGQRLNDGRTKRLPSLEQARSEYDRARTTTTLWPLEAAEPQALMFDPIAEGYCFCLPAGEPVQGEHAEIVADGRAAHGGMRFIARCVPNVDTEDVAS